MASYRSSSTRLSGNFSHIVRLYFPKAVIYSPRFKALLSLGSSVSLMVMLKPLWRCSFSSFSLGNRRETKFMSFPSHMFLRSLSKMTSIWGRQSREFPPNSDLGGRYPPATLLFTMLWLHRHNHCRVPSHRFVRGRQIVVLNWGWPATCLY